MWGLVLYRWWQGGYEVVEDLVAEDLIAPGIGAQVNGDNSFPGGTFRPRGVLYDHHTLFGLLSEQKVARNGILFGVGEVYRIFWLENDEFEVDFVAHTGEGS